MRLTVLDDAGRPLDAHLDFDSGDIVYHSRSGTRGLPGARNLDYGPALRLLLSRMLDNGYRLHGVWLDSDEVLHLPLHERVILAGSDLAASPDEQFRILSRAMQVFGRTEGAVYGGSRVKRIRLAGDWPRDEQASRAVLGIGMATDKRATDPADREENAGSAPQSAIQGRAEFDPASIEDGRQLIAMMVKRRQGQAGFRRALMKAYRGRCAVSGCEIAPLLEAAHIHPYRGPQTNAVENGLLLRADIHTLFDLGLITVSGNRQIRVSAGLLDTSYGSLHGRVLAEPQSLKDRPSGVALEWDRNEHIGRLMDS
ncbi:HNH endonuclease [Mesorhizobium sp. M0085]|uniref:HNH endonuclease n=1 Tax=Mesorhizobium sp. M0085 TaxID=2956872 RepID=UPI0033379582